MKVGYPTIFTQVADSVLVEVPDMEVLTEGKDLVDAIDMARDAIGATGISMEDHKETIPTASRIQDIDVEKGIFYGKGESFVSIVDIDFLEYRKSIENKTVRRSVTLPSWLNKEAEKANINVSRVLREALMEQLGVSR